MATRRANVAAVVFGAHTIGLIGVVAVAPLIAEVFGWTDLLYGMAGGVAGMIGLVLLYRRLAAGPMSVVAPITAVTSAVVPAIWALLRGESLTALVGIGMVVALIAITLIASADAPGEDTTPITAQVIVESLGAGAGFGCFFIFINQAAIEAAPWPIVGARIASVVLLGAWALARGVDRPTDGSTWRWIAMAGLLDTFSNVLFLWSANLAGLAVASVLTSLYPASTVVLAFFLLDERMTRTQLVGFVTAVVATALIASG